MNSRSRLAVVVLVLMVVGGNELSAGELGRAGQPPDGRQILVVYLRNQEQYDVAHAVQEEYEPRLRELARMMELTNRIVEGRLAPVVLESRDEEIEYTRSGLGQLSVTRALARARLQAAEALDTVRRSMRMEILARSEPARAESQGRVTSSVQAMGGEVLYRYSTVNAMAVAIPVDSIEALSTHPDVADVYEDRLTHGHMNTSPAAIGAPMWWSQGYTGGATDVAVLDSGVDDSHPALDPQLVLNRRCLDTADTYYPGMPGLDPTADDLNGHGTHVAGTVAMTNTLEPYLGIAPGLDVLLNGKAGFHGSSGGAFMYWSDGMACADWAMVGALDDAEVINLSYGSLASSDDGGYERFWDAVVDQMGAVVTISAGNDGPGTGTLNSPSIAYNVLSVANVWDNGTTTRADDVIWSGSSRGPTPSGRRKPDLAAPGTNITSANDNWEGGGLDYATYTGTSMAAPHVAGAAALLIDRGIVSPKDSSSGLYLQNFYLTQNGETQSYRYKLVLTQVLKNSRLINGKVKLQFEGLLDGEPKSLDLKEITTKKVRDLNYRFKYFQNVEGVVEFPKGFSVLRVKIQILPRGRQRDMIEKTIEWSFEEK